MNITYVGNFSQAHCTEVHLANTLEDLGHKVDRIQENNANPNWFDLALASDLFLFTRTWGNLVTNEHLDRLRKAGIPSASYHLDLYIGLKREDGLDNDPFWRTDFVFTPDGDPLSQEIFETKGINHYYMKPGVYKPECYISQAGSDLSNDVIFVGGGDRPGSNNGYGHVKEWPYRDQLVGWLYDTYGERFSKFGYPNQTVRNEQLNLLYANSKVTVGDSVCIGFSHQHYWSDRVYETLGRGGFLIHPYIKGMTEEFRDAVHLRYYEYDNFKALKYFIDYYIKNDAEREKIRLKGHEFVKNHATYNDRLKQMLEVVNGKAN